MKRRKELKEYRSKTKEELEKILFNLRHKLQDLRFKASLEELKNVKDISTIKRSIARILTIIKEKEKK